MSITNIFGHVQQVLVSLTKHRKTKWCKEWTATAENPPSGLEVNVLTCFFWPILCALACACRSFCGFQSESNITTVSADAKLIPKPPALVDSKKQKSWNYKIRNSFICSSCNILKGTSMRVVYAVCGMDYKNHIPPIA